MRHAACMAQGHDGVKGRDYPPICPPLDSTWLAFSPASAVDTLVKPRPGRLQHSMAAHRQSLLHLSLKLLASGHRPYNPA